MIVQKQRLRIPILEERPFELKAEFQTAQAVVPGQGQTLRVAGVKVGDVDDVELEDGVAVVTFGVDRDFLPIYRDATILLRPQTGLKDMFFEMDPGTQQRGRDRGGRHGPAREHGARRQPRRGPRRARQRHPGLPAAAARRRRPGRSTGRDKDLGQPARLARPDQPRPRRSSTRRSPSARTTCARLITNFNLLTHEVGRSEQSLTDLVESSNTSLGAIAEQDPSVQRAIAPAAGTLTQSTTTLNHISQFADQLGPAFGDLRPFARNLDEVNSSTKRLALKTTPVQDEIRPFVRTAREPVRTSARRPSRLAKATPKLTVVAKKINRLGNMAAYNPNGAEPPGTPGRDEGYLYWAAWLGHNSATPSSRSRTPTASTAAST